MVYVKHIRNLLFVWVGLLFVAVQPVTAAEWSNTEFQIQYGTLDTPEFAGGGRKDTLILTFQHASGWKYGENYFFFDVLNAEGDGFNDSDIYGEWYPYFSFGKMSGKKVGFGIVKDIGLIGGFNFSADAKVLKYLPGFRLALDLQGFAFFNVDITAYIDASEGAGAGGAPSQDDSFQIEVNWLYPFKIGNHSFTFEGHVEHIGERTNEFGGAVSDWVLAQPQLRYDANEHLAVGIEYQLWLNKLGDAATDENTVQALVVWKF